MTSRVLTDKHLEIIRRRREQGWSSVRIRDHLERTAGVSVTRQAIDRHIRAQAATRQNDAAAARADRALASARPAGLDGEAVAKMLAAALERLQNLAEGAHASMQLKVIGLIPKVLEAIEKNAQRAAVEADPLAQFDGLVELVGLAHREIAEERDSFLLRRTSPARWLRAEGAAVTEQLDDVADALGRIPDAAHVLEAVNACRRILGAFLERPIGGAT